MPVYRYRCENGHEFEVIQRYHDDPVERCQECDAPAKKLLSAPTVIYNGPGFHTTDYGKGTKAS